MPKSEANPVLKLFKWEDYHDGYMITFNPQTSFARFDDIAARVRNVWRDDSEIDMPPGEKLILVQPEEVPIWKSYQPELIKTEISDGIGNQYSEVLQGALGDCWFMSALSGLAVSGRLSEVVSRYDDKKGIYEFKLQRWDSKSRGFSPLYVCVDRRVPIVQGHKTPAYCYSATAGELWPSLLEKAFAKAIRVWKAHPSAERGGKGFSCMDGGLSALGVAHLLGGESGCYWVKEGTRWNKEQAVNQAQLFADLFEKGVFINVNFKEVSSKVVGPHGETRGNQGLVAGHSYSVLRLEFFNIRGHVFRLVQLRNPWGRTQAAGLEWSGDWGDKSPLWRDWPEAAQICLNERPGGGVFWISIEDLVENMDAFEICDAPLRPGAVTNVRSKQSHVVAPRRNAPISGRIRPSNELGARLADDYMRRTSHRAELERRRLEEQLALEREQRLKAEADLELAARRPKIARRPPSVLPPVEIVEGEQAVVIGSPTKRSSVTRNPTALQRQRQKVAQNMDAADGIIDGKYFGKPILTTSGSAIDLLTAAESKLSSAPRSPRRPAARRRATSVPREAAPRVVDALRASTPPQRSPIRVSSAERIARSPRRSASPPRTRSPRRSASPGRRPAREYDTWADSPRRSVLPAPSTIYSGSYRGVKYPALQTTTRSWVAGAVTEPVYYHGPLVIDQDQCTVVGAPSVVYTGPPSVVRRPASVVREVAPSYLRSASYVREVGVPTTYVGAPVTEYVRGGDVVVDRMVRPTTIFAEPGLAHVTEAF